jgi:hypothetical protein
LPVARNKGLEQQKKDWASEGLKASPELSYDMRQLPSSRAYGTIAWFERSLRRSFRVELASFALVFVAFLGFCGLGS